MNKPIKYRGYELVPVFKYEQPKLHILYQTVQDIFDWEIFKGDSEKGTLLHYKTLEESKEYVNDLIEE
jgi:hypothetical protein